MESACQKEQDQQKEQQNRIKLKVVPEIDQSWTIERIARERPPISWEKVFQDAMPELETVSEILEEKEKRGEGIFPFKKNIFKAFEITPIDCIRVIIVGQDPYPQLVSSTGQPRAQGFSFSVSKNDTIPSSLSNMYTELENTVPGFHRPWHGDLTDWARQGVLLLNMSLTVEPGKAGSHGAIWMGFISKALDEIAQRRPNAVYIMLGQQAQKLQKYISDRAPIVTAAHPSGLSARKGFFGSNVFVRTNQLLIKSGQTPINWQLDNHV